MTLTCDGKYTPNKYGVGVIIRKVTVADVADVSGQTAPFLERPWDIGIKLYLEVGRDFQPELTIAGSFKRDSITGEIVGWGSAFVVQEALQRFGYSGSLQEGNHIPQSVLEGLIGKEFYRLSYVSGRKENGKVKYTDWNQIATLQEGPEDLAGRFRKSLTRGYPKNYQPEVVLDGPEVVEVVAADSKNDPF
jgi:hypothetical protein